MKPILKKIDHLMVVDIDPEFFSSIELHLGGIVQRISGASSLHEGLSVLARYKDISCVLLGCPDIVASSEQILKLHPQMVIVGVMPRSVPASMREEAKKIGVKAVVAKPLNMLYLSILLESLHQ